MCLIEACDTCDADTVQAGGKDEAALRRLLFSLMTAQLVADVAALQVCVCTALCVRTHKVQGSQAVRCACVLL